MSDTCCRQKAPLEGSGVQLVQVIPLGHLNDTGVLAQAAITESHGPVACPQKELIFPHPGGWKSQARAPTRQVLTRELPLHPHTARQRERGHTRPILRPASSPTCRGPGLQLMHWGDMHTPPGDTGTPPAASSRPGESKGSASLCGILSRCLGTVLNAGPRALSAKLGLSLLPSAHASAPARPFSGPLRANHAESHKLERNSVQAQSRVGSTEESSAGSGGVASARRGLRRARPLRSGCALGFVLRLCKHLFLSLFLLC